MKQSYFPGFSAIWGLLFLGAIVVHGAEVELKASYPFNANADDVSGSGYHGSELEHNPQRIVLASLIKPMNLMVPTIIF